MKQYLLAFLILIGLSSSGLAQTNTQLTDLGTEETDSAPVIILPEDMEASYSMWSDPLYFQFDQMMPKLARSLGRLENRVHTIAVTDIAFGPTVEKSFYKVATARIFGQLLLENPRLKLIKCNECNMIQSELRSGILTISRGLADQESRRALARKLNVQGFMTTMVIEQDRQLSIVVNIVDAEEGRVILSDVVQGVPAPKSTYYNYYMGQMELPVTMGSTTAGTTGEVISQNAIVLGAEKTIRFSKSWLLSANMAFYMDNNSKLAQSLTFSPRLMVDGLVGWEMMALNNNNISFAMLAGIGEFWSEQFNFSIYYKAGLKIIVGQLLTFNYYSLSFQETNLEVAPTTGSAAKLNGSGSSITFGFQF
ncbi:MAG: hypothetical protein OEY59_01265 [Deltaproteobacteria bacterium]|nr:hypothetical protein [Deltaproteobacteria bacterium]